MASPSLLGSAMSTFHGQFPAVPPSPTIRFQFGNPRYVVVKATAAGTLLVQKTESEKVNHLKSTYVEKIVPRLTEEFSHTNVLQVPKVEKIVVNCGIGDARQNAKGLEAAMNTLALITGQRPVKTRARASIATLKIREGQPLGIAVTLRGSGVNPSSFDGHGNYCIRIRDQSVFPEIRFDALGKPKGMDVCITTTAKTDKEGQKLLALMGMLFREGGGPATMVRKKKLKAHHFDSKGKGRGRR